MAEKKKILYIVEAMGGGVFTYIVDLANELVNKYDMYIAYAVRKQTPKNYKDYFDKNVMLETSIVFKNFSTTDNQYLLIFYNYGLIALIVILSGAVKCIVRFIRTYRSNMFGSFDNKQMDADDVRIWTGEDAVEAILCYKVPIGCYCKMFKREVLKTTRFIPEVFIGEGFNFNVAAFQKSNRILAGKLKTYFYRRDNPTSAMTKFSIKKCECGLKALDIIKENLQIHTDRVQTAWEFADWRTHSDFYDAMVLAKVKNEYPEFYRKCLNVTKQRALVALKVPTTRSNKIRAILMRVCPAIIPFMLKIREKRHNVNISHR